MMRELTPISQTRVLLSFSCAYAQLAKQLAADLRCANIQVVYDQWIGGGGMPSIESVAHSLAGISFIIPLLTPSEATPIWIGAVWKRTIYDPARRQKIDILPVLGAECRPPKFLEDISYANLFHQRYALEFQRLVRTIYHRSGDSNIKLPDVDSLSKGDLPKDDLSKENLSKGDLPKDDLSKENLSKDGLLKEAPSPFTPPAHPILMELGEALFSQFESPFQGSLEEKQKNTFFNEHLPMLRDGLFYELGVAFPPVAVRGNAALPPHSARILLNDVPESQLEIPPQAVMVNARVDVVAQCGIMAEPAVNPASGANCAWIPQHQWAVAQEKGWVLWDMYGFMVLWLGAVLRPKAADFIGVDEVREMVARLKPIFPRLIAETLPEPVSYFLLADVLRRLLRESVSIRNLPKILMALSEWGRLERDPLFLTEYARAALKRQITHRLTRGTRQFVVFLLAPDIESLIHESLQYTPTGTFLNLPAESLQKILAVIQHAMAAIPSETQVPQILTTMEIRSSMRRLVALSLPQLHLISYQELMPTCNIQPLGRISLNNGVSWRSGVTINGVPWAHHSGG